MKAIDVDKIVEEVMKELGKELGEEGPILLSPEDLKGFAEHIKSHEETIDWDNFRLSPGDPIDIGAVISWIFGDDASKPQAHMAIAQPRLIESLQPIVSRQAAAIAVHTSICLGMVSVSMHNMNAILDAIYESQKESRGPAN